MNEPDPHRMISRAGHRAGSLGTKVGTIPVQLAFILLLPLQAVTDAPLPTDGEPAKYSVRLPEISPPRLEVTARIPIAGKLLLMEKTRPGDIPVLLSEGWPAFIRNLLVTDEVGARLDIAGRNTAGWELRASHQGWITLNYAVDFSIADSLGWPAPRELAFKDSEHFMFVCRSTFITTPEIRSSIVSFSLPDTWKAVAPWGPVNGSSETYEVKNTDDLVTNLAVFTRDDPDGITAGSFRVLVTPMGHWQPVVAEIKHLVGATVPRFQELMGDKGRAYYSVVLLPMADNGGESFRNSFAYTVEQHPASANRSEWGHTIAHEIFHYWNGWRLQGDEYAGSQWFQEGFTEYASDLAMVNAGVMTADDFRERLATYIQNYKQLTTPLNAPGTHKGPPLYSGGALVAFCWDVQIRSASGGKHSLGDVFRKLWELTAAGQRTYAWSDIRAALRSAAPLDWDTFYAEYIAGQKSLPLASACSLAGLKLVPAGEGIRIEQEAAAPAAAGSLWDELVHGE